MLIRGPAVLLAGAVALEALPTGNRAAEDADGARTVPRADGDPDAGLLTAPSAGRPVPRLRTLPRATPRPAESPRISDLPGPGSRTLTPTGALRLTIKVCPGVAGGLGTLKCCGGIHDARDSVPSRPGASRPPEPAIGVDDRSRNRNDKASSPTGRLETQAYPAPGYHVQAPFMNGSQPAPTR